MTVVVVTIVVVTVVVGTVVADVVVVDVVVFVTMVCGNEYYLKRSWCIVLRECERVLCTIVTGLLPGSKFSSLRIQCDLFLLLNRYYY